MRLISPIRWIQVDGNGLHRLAAAKVEKLGSEARAMLGGLTNLFQFRTQRVPLTDPAQQNVTVAIDQGQQVGEIVGNAR